MTAKQLIDLIGRRGLLQVAGATDFPIRVAMPGVNLADWELRKQPGAFLFCTELEGQPDVLVLNADEGQRAKWQKTIDETAHRPTVLVLMVAGGQPPEPKEV